MRGALEEHSTKLITLTCGPAGTKWYSNGVPVRMVSEFIVPHDALKGRLILGDAAGGQHAWSGRMYGLAIFNRTLNDEEVLRHFQAWTNHEAAGLADESDLLALFPLREGQGQWAQDQSSHRHRLFIPRYYRTLHRTVLAWPSEPEGPVSGDVWINVLGFVPFGFLVYWHRRSTVSAHRLRAAGHAILLGGALSLLIELTQIWLPNRDSSSLDLLCNILGALLGAAMAMLVESRLSRGQNDRS
jgi:VanZ family protein